MLDDSLVLSAKRAGAWWHTTVALLLAVIALLALKCAWVSDDAYITFRTVDNFVHGFGLRWNPAERVQAYTSPLWMFAMSALAAVTRDVYFTSIALGILVTLAACALLAMRAANGFAGACVALLLLASSKAFIDFATSGLENPLLHLGLIASVVAFGARGEMRKRSLGLALAASAVALTRPDGVLLVAPLLVVQLMHSPKRATLASYALGFAPLVLWEIFSLVYYGFLIPNTAYAKLSTGLSMHELLAQGARYFADSLARDPLTLGVIAAALVVAAWRRERVSLALAAGIVMHLIYVATVGGDFMSGRFFTAPLVCAVCILASTPLSTFAAAASAVAALGLSMATPLSPLRAPLDYSRDLKPPEHIDDSGIADERGYWFGAAGLFSPNRALEAPPYKHISKGHGYAFKLRDEGPKVLVPNGIGYIGYWAGPTVHLVDPMGLSDALIARLPFAVDDQPLEHDKNKFRERTWRIGHFIRRVPEGYVESLADPSQRIADPAIAELRQRLDLITRGDLWSSERWRAIVAEMFGG
jgi:arabinofuranosyltransferase